MDKAGETRLKPRQERFCQEFVSDIKRNQTAAAIRAGYAKNSARISASQLMRIPNVAQRIKELELQALEDAGYDINVLKPLIMRRLVAQATFDISEIIQVIYSDDGRRQQALERLQDLDGGQGMIDFGEPLIYIKPTSDWTPEQRAAVKGIEMTKEGIKITPHDGLSALRHLSDIMGLTKAADLSLNFSVSGLLTEARQRAFASSGPMSNPVTQGADGAG